MKKHDQSTKQAARMPAAPAERRRPFDAPRFQRYELPAIVAGSGRFSRMLDRYG